MSVNSTESPIERVKRRLDKSRLHMTSYKGSNGYFIRAGRLDDIQHDIDILLEDSNVDSGALLTLHEEVLQLRSANAVAEGQLVELEKEASALRQEKKALSSSFDKAKAEFVIKSGALTQERDELVQTLKTVEGNLGKLKADQAAARRTNDVEAAESLMGKLEVEKKQVGVLKANLHTLNTQLKEMMGAQDKANKDFHAKCAELSKVSADLSALRASKEAAEHDLLNAPVTVQINDSFLTRAIGQKGIEWVKKAAAAREMEIRERAHNLLMAVKSGHRNKQIAPFVAILQALFDWIKSATYKARVLVKSWLDEFQKDFSAGRLKSLEHYRKGLEKILEGVKLGVRNTAQAVKESSQKYAPKFTWWDTVQIEVSLWTGRFKRSARRGFRRLVSGARGFFSTCKGWMFSPWNARRQEHVKHEVLFQQEEEEYLLKGGEDQEPDNVSGTEEPLGAVSPRPLPEDDDGTAPNIRTGLKPRAFSLGGIWSHPSPAGAQRRRAKLSR